MAKQFKSGSGYKGRWVTSFESRKNISEVMRLCAMDWPIIIIVFV